MGNAIRDIATLRSAILDVYINDARKQWETGDRLYVDFPRDPKEHIYPDSRHGEQIVPWILRAWTPQSISDMTRRALVSYVDALPTDVDIISLLHEELKPFPDDKDVAHCAYLFALAIRAQVIAEMGGLGYDVTGLSPNKTFLKKAFQECSPMGEREEHCVTYAFSRMCATQDGITKTRERRYAGTVLVGGERGERGIIQR